MKKYKLRELLTIKNGKDHKQLKEGVYPVLGSGGVMRYVDTFLYDKPSVLLPRKGSLNNIQYSDKPFWTVDTLYYTEVNEKKVNAYYLYNYLKLLDLSNLDSGTGVPSMTFDSYYNLSVNLPSLEIQNKVASALFHIDEKISINRQINRNLEELAKQIYDYWFVQFDFPNEEGKPYKSSGGKMVWNETLKRKIPAGWEVKRLGEILVKIDSGKRPAGGINKALKSGIPSLGAECIDDLGVFDFSSTPFIDNSYRNKLTTGKICNNDILVYKDGAYVGKITLFRDNFPYEEAFVNEHVFLIHAQEECLEEYLYFSLKQKAYFQIMQNLGKAKAAQPGLNREDMQNILLIVPNKNIVSVFHNKVGLLFENIFNNARAIGNLSSLRDNLIPLLMNGQVTLNSCLSLIIHLYNTIFARFNFTTRNSK